MYNYWCTSKTLSVLFQSQQNVIICMVHSTSTKSMDIMDIKNLQQNLLGRILHREKNIWATSRVNPLSLSTRNRANLKLISQSWVPIYYRSQSLMLIYPVIYYNSSFLHVDIFPNLTCQFSACDIYISFCQNIKFKPCHGMFIHLQPLQLTWFRFSTKWFGLSM